jgi:hypothetical protein
VTPPQWSAASIHRLLSARHAKDVYVPECKLGNAGSRVMDAWVLLPTWSPMTAIGYEVKVSRSDWLRDQKFEAYRACCHLMFVVAPKGVVQHQELPGGVGLLEPIGQGDGARLVTRVKPTRHQADAEALVKVMAHVLMWRKDRANHADPRARAAVWREWVDGKREGRTIASQLRGRIQKELREAERRVFEAEGKAKQLQDAADALRELGITPGYDRWQTKRKIEAALADGQTVAAIIKAIDSLQAVLDATKTESAA